jgi:hypothetical protein
MSWKDRLLSTNELPAFVVPPSGGSGLPPEGGTTNALAKALLQQQIETWPALRDAVAGFNQVEYKSFSVKGSEVLTQFNPKRIVSAGAKVDAATIGQRPCFLCPDNLPKEEKGIAFGASFVILCNPFPVLRDHLVIASRQHTPQEINGSFGAFLDLTRELGEGWFTLYNGARCGASAPDHLHFQACSSNSVPLFDDVKYFSTQKTAEGLRLITSERYRLNFVAAQTDQREALIGWFAHAVNALGEVTAANEEPMFNLVATYWDEQWTIFVFPRAKHRPDCYFAEGEKQLLVSPGAIDLAGVMVVPPPDHYARITRRDLEGIYAEVSLDDTRFQQWLAIISLSGEQNREANRV